MLTFDPAADQNGSPYATFQFRVSDGTLFSTSNTAMTVNVTAVEDAAAASPNSVTTAEDTAFTFTTAQFNFADVDAGDTLQAVKITGLATNGTLKYNGAAVSLNQVITAADVSAGVLTFVPAADQNGSPYATFQFRVSDGSLFSTSDTAMTVNVTPVEDAPMSGPGTVTTAEDLDYVFTSADFPFSDVDAGDTLQSVKITSLATAGTI